MAYTLSNLETDIRNYTEVDDTVFSSTILNGIIKNGENRIYRDADSDDNRFYATSTLVTGNRYVTIPSDLRSIRYVQLKDTNVTPNTQTFLDKKDASYMATYYDTPATTLAYVKQPISITDTTQPTGAPASTNGTYTSNKYQDLLLYACLVEAYGYLKGPADMLQYYEGSYRRALQSYAVEQMGRRRRDEYQDGVIRTPLQSPSP
jgi:hypothetical protein